MFVYGLNFMKKYVVFLMVLCFVSFAKANEWTFSAKGLVGAYYGVSETKGKNKYPNRWVGRGDATVSVNYVFEDGHKLGVEASTTIMFRQDDKNRRGGEYRFYPYVKEVSKYGEIYLGYAKNAATMLHKGAKDITFLGVDDSNITYFLDNSNWNNGYKKTYFATPKSTSIMNDGRAPKLVYIAPVDETMKVGFSYAPNNANRRGMTSRYVDYEEVEDGYTFATQKKWSFDDSDLYASLGYGLFNRTDKELSLGITLEKGNFNIASGYKKAYGDGDKNPISTIKVNNNLPAYFDNYRESQAWNISVGYKWNKYKTNLAYLLNDAKNTRHQDNIVLWSNVYEFDKGFEIYGAGGYLRMHGTEQNDDDRGYAIIGGVGFRF